MSYFKDLRKKRPRERPYIGRLVILKGKVGTGNQGVRTKLKIDITGFKLALRCQIYGLPIATEQFFTLILIRLSEWPQLLVFRNKSDYIHVHFFLVSVYRCSLI